MPGRPAPNTIPARDALARAKASRAAAIAACLPLILAAAPAAAAELRLNDDGTLETDRQRVTLGPLGLPEQIAIIPATEELPLERRGENAQPHDEAVLVRIGRGPRLAGPMAIQTMVKGKPVPAAPDQAAAPKMRHNAAVAEADAAAGSYQLSAALRYTDDGRLAFDITTRQTQVDAQPLQLIIPLAGQVNLLYTGVPDQFTIGQSPGKVLEATLPPTEDPGEVWASDSGKPAEALPRLYLGSPDAGFAWAPDNSWPLPGNQPLMIVHRTDAGRLEWRITLRGGEAKGERRHRFTLRALPAGTRPEDHRRRAWLDWPDEKAQTLHADDKTPAWPFDAAPGGYRSCPDVGAAIGSVERDHVDQYPNGFMQTLLAPAAGQAVRLQPNLRDLLPTRADLPGADRQILGRALLHDAAVDIRRLAQPVEGLRTIAALRAFGYFQPDHTEFIPYWRTEGIVRFGEAFDPDSAFNLTQQDPARDTFVSIYRRPIQRDGRTGMSAMFIIMNQQPRPVRAKLYVLQPRRVFGAKGRNDLKARDALDLWDFAEIPDGSDWRRQRISHFAGSHGLLDIEQKSPVIEASNKGLDARVEGPIYIPARDYRILYGQWLAEPENTAR